MTEPKKILFVFLVVMSIGLMALAVEFLKDRWNGWLALIVCSVILLIMALTVHSGAMT